MKNEKRIHWLHTEAANLRHQAEQEWDRIKAFIAECPAPSEDPHMTLVACRILRTKIEATASYLNDMDFALDAIHNEETFDERVAAKMGEQK